MWIVRTILLTVLFVAVAAGQGRQGLSIVKGRVIDENYGAIADTRITLTDRNGNNYQVISEKDGSFQIDVPPDVYTVTAEYTKPEAWDRFLLDGLVLSPATFKSLTITLKVNKERMKIHGSPVTGVPQNSSEAGVRRIDSQNVVLVGTVYDREGFVCPGIRVTLRDKKGKIFVSTSNGGGRYRIEVPAGRYSVKFDDRMGNWIPVEIKNYYVAPACKDNMVLDISIGGKVIEDTFGVGKQH